MIARTVHGCVPEEQVKKEVFSSYVLQSPPKNDVVVMDIDLIPCYV